MKMPVAAALAAVALLVPAASSVAAPPCDDTYCNQFIAAVPYTITAPGHYCLRSNLATAITSGAAITVNSDGVVLDLRNFRIDGSAAGLATEAAGVFVNGRDRVTVRAGHLRGFAIGISVEGATPSSSSGILIEDNTVSDSTKAGIQVWAELVTIRRNTVTNTGGSTSSVLYGTALGAFTTGISTTDRQFRTHLGYAGPIEIVDNTILNTFAPAAGGFTVAIQGASSHGGLVARNRIVKVTGTAGNAIQAYNTSDTCRDNSVLNSQVPGYDCGFMSGVNDDN